MAYRLLAAAAITTALSACATGPSSFPVQTTRFHYDAMTTRGTIAVEPLSGGAPASLEYKEYAAAVQAELLRLGYANPPSGAKPQNLATVSFTRALRPLPPRPTPAAPRLGPRHVKHQRTQRQTSEAVSYRDGLLFYRGAVVDSSFHSGKLLSARVHIVATSA